MNFRLLALMAMAGIDPSAAVAFVDEPPPTPHPPLPPELVLMGASKGKAAPGEPIRRMPATGAPPTFVLTPGTEPRKTRAERRKGMARTSPQVLAVREARRRQKRARAAGRAK